VVKNCNCRGPATRGNSEEWQEENGVLGRVPPNVRSQVEATVVGAGIHIGWHELVNQCQLRCLSFFTKQESPRASSPHQASLDLSPTSPLESAPLPCVSIFSKDTGTSVPLGYLWSCWSSRMRGAFWELGLMICVQKNSSDLLLSRWG
jgi:hypothetical protein